MIIIGGMFEVEPGQREQFLLDRCESMRTSRTEEGCFEYVFSADPIDPARVVIFERWATEQDLDAHISRMRARPQSRSAKVVPKATSITKYEISGEGPLGAR